MQRTIARLSLCLPLCLPLLLAAGAARAQDAGGADRCPRLPGNSGLSWEARSSEAGDFCRALFADGSEAFGLYVTQKRNVSLARRNRAERGYTIDGHQVIWYRTEIAASPGIEARETNLELSDGRYAHIWLQAASLAELPARLQLAGGMHFDGVEIVD